MPSQRFPDLSARTSCGSLLLPQDKRPELIGRLHEDPRSRTFAELLIDLEEDRQVALDIAQALKGRR